MVGSRLCAWLVEAGASVVAFVADDDPMSEFHRSGTSLRTSVVNGRLEDYDDVERAINNHSISSIFHLGAQPIVGAANRAPRHTFESNIRGTWNVLDAARVLEPLVRRIVVASSDKAYGASTTLPYTESMPLAGGRPYEVSKSCADLIATTYASTFRLPCTIARCGNIYGPGDLNWNRIVPGTFRSLIEGTRPVLRSDGTLIRDYLHVDDVVAAYLLLGEQTHLQEFQGRAFNFSDESPRSVLEIYRAVCISAGRPDVEPDILGEAHDEIVAQYLDATRAHDELGWYASIGLEDGLLHTFEWYRGLLDGDGA